MTAMSRRPRHSWLYGSLPLWRHNGEGARQGAKLSVGTHIEQAMALNNEDKDSEGYLKAKNTGQLPLGDSMPPRRGLI